MSVNHKTLGALKNEAYDSLSVAVLLDVLTGPIRELSGKQ